MSEAIHPGDPVLIEPMSMCRALVGLADVNVIGVMAGRSRCRSTSRPRYRVRPLELGHPRAGQVDAAPPAGRSALVRPAGRDGVAIGPLALPGFRLPDGVVDAYAMNGDIVGTASVDQKRRRACSLLYWRCAPLMFNRIRA